MKVKNILLLTEEIQLNTGTDLINAVRKNKVDGVNPKTEVSEKLAQDLIDKFKGFPIQYKSQAIRLALKHSLNGLPVEEASPYLTYFANRNKKIIKTKYKEFFDNFYNGKINQKDFEKQVKEILENEGKDKPLATKIYEDENWLAVIPKNFSASCKYGEGTTWCTTQDIEHFNYYTQETPLIIITNKRLDSRKSTMAKIAITTAEEQFQDAKNKTLKDEERYNYLKSLPEKLQQILEKYNISKKEYNNKKYNNILINAAKNNNIEKAKEAIENGANIHANHDEALIYACLRNNIELVKLLLDNGANIHANHDEALIYACYGGNIELVKLLFDNGANIHAQDDRVLIVACRNNNIELVKFLLKYNIDIHAQDDEALMYACYNGNIELVKFLLNHGADIHARDDEAFIIACRKNYVELIKLLLDRGADIHAQNDRGLLLIKQHYNKEFFNSLNSYLKK